MVAGWLFADTDDDEAEDEVALAGPLVPLVVVELL